MPAATNAHGSSNSNQYSKPATYGSGYGTYDALSQTQDYTKAGYVGSTQGQKGSGANASSTVSTGSDLSAMYPKTHTTLGKVNVIFFFFLNLRIELMLYCWLSSRTRSRGSTLVHHHHKSYTVTIMLV